MTLLALPLWISGIASLAWAAIIHVVFRDRITFRWLIAYDQLGNALAFGDPDETISSRAGKCARTGKNRPCYWLCRVLHVLDKRHCEKSIEYDEGDR